MQGRGNNSQRGFHQRQIPAGQQIAYLNEQVAWLMEVNQRLGLENEALTQKQQASEQLNQKSTSDLASLREEYDRLLKETEEWKEKAISQSQLVAQYEAALGTSQQENFYLQQQVIEAQRTAAFFQSSNLYSPYNFQRPQLSAFQAQEYIAPISSATSMKKTKLESFEDRVFKLPSEGLHTAAHLDPLRTHLDENEESGLYFQQFIPYIMEEVRAKISEQLKTIIKKQLRSFAVDFEDNEEKETDPNNQYIQLTGYTTELPRLDHGFYSETVLIVTENISQEKKWRREKNNTEENNNFDGILAIATARPEYDDDADKYQQRRDKITLKLPKKDYQQYISQWQKQNYRIYVHHLCGLIPSSRMYQICSAMPKVDFESQFIYGKFKPWPAITAPSAHPMPERCNPSQQEALETLGQATSGIYCLQGPPGTGKTTTVVNLLQQWVLVHPTEKTLLCAPTNEAVRVVLKQAKKQFPDVYMALTGVGKDLPPELAGVFASQYTQNLYKPLIALKREVEKFRNNPVILAQIKNGIQQNYLQINEDLNELKDSLTLTPMVIKEETKRQIMSLANDFSSTPLFLDTPEQVITTLEGLISQLQHAYFIESFLLQRAQIVFSTLVSSGRDALQKAITSFDRLIIDEASQALIPEALIPLRFNPKICVHVGDPMQLPAIVTSTSAQEGGYGTSLMSWLMEHLRQDYRMLKEQYRMHPHICQLPSDKYYEGQLRTADSVLHRPSILDNLTLATIFQRPSVFFNIQGEENRQ